MAELSGAGGYWPVINETIDPNVVKQKDKLSCGPACGEMLLKDSGVNNVDQYAIASQTGVPVDVSYLATALNLLDPINPGKWHGGYFELEENDIILLTRLMVKRSWSAELREPGNRLGHLVVVDGGIEIGGIVIPDYLTQMGKIQIRDPWDGTRYQMKIADFLNFWTRRGVYRG
ncbi:MAG TPA: hypothetical protein IGS52_02875 [Oscillatoriaceae cyanobacterium M33_DOE_052]|uniref:Peptidase C39 domain-containing protein n=1 Tax=Planktothricoides sp. SpSt-374 TaxID=2282167 RepID=A0A7C3VRB0_9CYAN|nr:hypothetical protein [Oscillatoriaceae cyanobacterium M33_DOE_052]